MSNDYEEDSFVENDIEPNTRKKRKVVNVDDDESDFSGDESDDGKEKEEKRDDQKPVQRGRPKRATRNSEAQCDGTVHDQIRLFLLQRNVTQLYKHIEKNYVALAGKFGNANKVDTAETLAWTAIARRAAIAKLWNVQRDDETLTEKCTFCRAEKPCCYVVFSVDNTEVGRAGQDCAKRFQLLREAHAFINAAIKHMDPSASEKKQDINIEKLLARLRKLEAHRVSIFK